MPFAPGIVVGAYELLAQIGSGGIGVVYKAQDTHLDRFVALKFVRDNVAKDPQGLSRFRREAKAASALNHPNICTIYDYRGDGGPCLHRHGVSQWHKPGQRMAGGSLDLDTARSLAIEIADAVDDLHNQSTECLSMKSATDDRGGRDMAEVKGERRRFLRAAGRLIAALPFLSVAPQCVAEAAKPGGERQTSDHPNPVSASVRLNVRDFGSAGDGKTKDTLVIQQALDRCNVLGGGEVLAPKGDYLIGAIVLRSNTTLRLADGATLFGSPDLADYPLTQVRWEGRWSKGYIGLISAIDAVNISIAGRGKIVGNPAIKGRVDPETQVRHPALLEFTSCKNVRVEDCVTVQNDMWSIHPTYCEDITFRNLTVQGGADGIDVDSSRRVIIDGCNFSTGDDCISLKSGRGAEGYAIQRPTENVRITNCTFADSHWPVPGVEGIPGIRGFHFSNVRATDVPVLVQATSILPSMPLQGFSLTNVSGTCGKGIFLANITHAELRNIKVTGFSGALVNAYNVTGTGLRGAASLEPTKIPAPIPPALQPYWLH